MKIKEGNTYYFYDDRATNNVCKAHVLHILPHPENEGDQLIVYRWYGKHRRRWWYGATTSVIQEIWEEYCKEVVRMEKERRNTSKAKKYGNCDYSMRHISYKKSLDLKTETE